MNDLLSLIYAAGFIILVYFVGKHIEGTHYEDIKKREQDFLNIPVLTARRFYETEKIADCQLVTGNVVISGDYFKMLLATILKIFGGRIIGYEALIDRGRREAILRLKENARQFGADAVINMRFETSKLDGMVNNNSKGMFEILAYGTAIKLK